MDRVSPSFKHHRFQLGIAALSLGLAFLAGTCDNPVDLLGEVEVKVMKANDRYLEVIGVSPVNNAVGVNPGGSIRIVVDREVDMATVTSSSVLLQKASDNSMVSWNASYNNATRTLSIQPDPYLLNGTTYTVSVDGLKGTDGSDLLTSISWGFRTGVAPAGGITVFGLGDTGYTRSTSVTVTVTPNAYAQEYAVSLTEINPNDLEGLEFNPVATSTPVVLPASEGDCTIFVIMRGMVDEDVAHSVVYRPTIILDQTAPIVDVGTDIFARSTESISSTIIESNVKSYLWTVESGSSLTLGTPDASSTSISAAVDGQRTVRLTVTDKAGNSASDELLFTWDTLAPSFSLGSAVTANATYTFSPTITETNPLSYAWSVSVGSAVTFGSSSAASTTVSATTDGNRTIRLIVTDKAGNATSGTVSFTWDTTPPIAPTVSGPSPTNDTTPTWTWTAGGGGNGMYRYNIDGGTWVATTATTYTPVSALTSNTTHTLYVQERDSIGNWSGSGSKTLTIDTIAPNSPIVSGMTPTNDTTPTWTWTSGGGSGSGTYQYQLNSTTGTWTTTTATSYTPSVALTANTTHTLYVREYDAAGNISNPGSRSIEIDTVKPNNPIFTVTSPTTNRTPTWSWTSGGGGNGQFQYYVWSPLTPSGWSALGTATSFTPSAEVADGTYQVGAQERDDAGNYSNLVATFIVVNAPPKTPIISGPTSPTFDSTPTWTWTSGGFGSGTFQYYWNSVWSADTTATSYTPAALADGVYTLYAREKDAGGEWSSNGSRTIRVTSVLPYDGQTGVSRLPTLSWRDKGSLASYTLQFYASGTWNDYSVSPGTNESLKITTSLPALTTLTWRVKAVIGKITSYLPDSEGAQFTTGP